MLTHRELVTEARRVAVEIGSDFGAVDDATVLQDTNNVVVWLQPQPIVAKVGFHPHSADALAHELAVGRFLAQHHAPIAAPHPETTLIRHRQTGFVVTLWQHLDTEPGSEPGGLVVGQSLRQLHQSLAAYAETLPDFRDNLLMTRAALHDDQRMVSLDPDERRFLRGVFDRLLGEVSSLTVDERPLHGEPHEHNYLATRSGVRWIDFEAACVGPLEWDLASLRDDALAAFPERDDTLLQTLITLNSARVATWCWARGTIPEMRQHAQHHLTVVHQRAP